MEQWKIWFILELEILMFVFKLIKESVIVSCRWKNVRVSFGHVILIIDIVLSSSIGRF